MRLSVGGDEWVETHLVLLGGLFIAWAWLTEGTEGAGGEWHRVQKISTVTAVSIPTPRAQVLIQV